MIPHKIQIKNFLSYGADLQTIDFSPHHLIYLSGKNGHGKSALLDAMTWALWGQARKITNAVKPDQGLLRLGQTHMIVIFDFELNGQMYRVRREYEKMLNKPIASVEFGLLDAQTEVMVPLTDKTARLTQAVIEKTIRLDYESFINSAFLRQGHANEFCQKSPKDRKEILGTILGLQQFDQLKKRATEKAKELLARRQAVCSVNQMIAEQLKDEKEIEDQLRGVGKALQDMAKQEQSQDKEQAALSKQRALLAEKQKLYDQLLFKNQEHERAMKKQLEQFKEHVARWRVVHKKQLHLPDYRQIEKEKKVYAAQHARQQKIVQDRLTLQEKILMQRTLREQKKIAIQKQYAEIVQSLTVTQERLLYEKKAVTALQEQADKQKTELVARIATQEKEQAVLDANRWPEKKFLVQEQQFENRKNIYQQFIAKGNWLKSELDAIQQKGVLMHDDNPSCPMCEQNLSASRRKFLRNTFAKRKNILVHQYDRLSRVVGRLKTLLLVQHKELELQKNTLNQQQQNQKESAQADVLLKEVEKQILLYAEQLKKIELQLSDGEKELQKQQRQERDALQKDAAYQVVEKEVLALEKFLRELSYDEKMHAQIQKKLQELEQQVADYVHLQHEIHNQNELARTVSGLVVALKQQKNQLVSYQNDLKNYDQLGKQHRELAKKEQEVEQLYRIRTLQKEKLIGQQGSLKSKSEQFAKLKQESEKQQRSMEALNKEIDEYQTIAAAVGKDGIQALLIEQAIPEIEQEANSLLSKLTNNQSQIFIESLRDLKSGGSKETLDVNIADPTGIRPYELFSGGEAFRIDFALRIAISKLLARRAGTALQTLIIDEGFGSQDEEGLSRIMDAIHRVQDDFEKVIIVSHLPAMREQFPVHFMVEKTMNGSCVTVVQQG